MERTLLSLLTSFLSFNLLAAELPPICAQAMKEPLKNTTDCPYPPKRKNTVNCNVASPTDLNRHAPGYRDYVLGLILAATEKTKDFDPFGVDPGIVMSVLAQESWYNPMTTNQWKDTGIAQFQVETAKATVEYMRTIGVNVPSSVNTEIPPDCHTTTYNTPLSAACFKSLKAKCGTAPYTQSLYCPGFGLELMAFHFLQIQRRTVMVDHQNNSYDVAMLLTPPDDFAAEIRHLTSVYNRGFRIYNSAYHSFLKNKVWPTANRYGALWSAPRSGSESNDPYPGGSLTKHFINRCYVWAIAGICGGMKNSLVSQYKDILCPRNEEQIFSVDETVDSDLIFNSYRDGNPLRSSQLLKANQLIGQKYLPLSLALYEGGFAVNEFELTRLLQQMQAESYLSYMQVLTQKPAKNAVRLQIESLKNIFATHIQQRNAGLRLLKAYAKRQWLQNRADHEWLYLAGLAGFYHHNSGLNDLQKYLDVCASSADCQNIDQARKYFTLGTAMVPSKNH